MGSAKPPLAPAAGSAAPTTPLAPITSQTPSAAGGRAPLPPPRPNVDAGTSLLPPTAADAGLSAPFLPPSDAPPSAEPAPATPAEATAPLPGSPGEIVITELLIDPASTGDSAGEWLELYNPHSHELELRGCEVDDGGKTPHAIEQSLRLLPHAYVTLARPGVTGFTPSAAIALSLTNRADTVALRCLGVEIDRVSYDAASGFAIESGRSLTLDPERLDASQNDAADAWCAAQESYGPEHGSPGVANPPCHSVVGEETPAPEPAPEEPPPDTDDAPPAEPSADGEPEPEQPTDDPPEDQSLDAGAG
ncbi:MAG: lamin tail domain-containing protein [Polyangiales bacterium]